MKQAVDFRSAGRFRDDTVEVVRGSSPDDFAVLSGEDDALVDLLKLGGVGIVSAAGNIPYVARAFLAVLEAWKDGDQQAATELHESVLPLVMAVFVRKNPIPLGAFFNSPVYLPLVDLEETRDGVEARARVMELIETAAPDLMKYHR